MQRHSTARIVRFRLAIIATCVIAAAVALLAQPRPAAASHGFEHLCPAGQVYDLLTEKCFTPSTGYKLASDDPTYKGWGSLGGQHSVCQWGPAYLTIWPWTATGWKQATVACGTTVYVWPFTTGWTWVWRSGPGWAAVPSNQVIIGHGSVGIIDM